MTFKPAEPNENFFQRWVSTDNRWEIGFTKMMYGVRVRFGLNNSLCCTLDICAGADQNFQDDVMRAVKLILLPIPECATEREIFEEFPRCYVKPINLYACWGLMKAKADRIYASLNQKFA